MRLRESVCVCACVIACVCACVCARTRVCELVCALVCTFCVRMCLYVVCVFLRARGCVCVLGRGGAGVWACGCVPCVCTAVRTGVRTGVRLCLCL